MSSERSMRGERERVTEAESVVLVEEETEGGGECNSSCCRCLRTCLRLRGRSCFCRLASVASLSSGDKERRALEYQTVRSVAATGGT